MSQLQANIDRKDPDRTKVILNFRQCRLCVPRVLGGPQGLRVRNCLTDEGGPFGTGLQELISNHLRRLWSKAMVVSA